jgi:acetyltransferase-like isoleucine patch superfamily enzyme
VTAMAQQAERLRALWLLLRGRMRARLLAARGARIGARTGIGPRCVIDRPWCIEAGERVLLEPDVFLKIVADTARLTLGEHVFVGRGTEFDVIGSVSVGAHTVIAPRCFITDHNHGIRPERRIDQQPCAVAPVVIGADVWLGACVVVLPGVSIGDGAVVGANAVVTRDVAPMTIVAGAPARILRPRSGSLRERGPG